MAVTINIPHDPTKVTVYENILITGISPLNTTLKSGRVFFLDTNIPPLSDKVLTLDNTDDDWTYNGIFISIRSYDFGLPIVREYNNTNSRLDIMISNISAIDTISNIDIKFIDMGQ